ncbi:MAG: aconitase X [Anaerolineae bacterium]
MTGLSLNVCEQHALDGRLGRGRQLAAQLVTALGTIYGAHDLVPVASAQIAGVSYRNLGRAGLEFLSEWAQGGAAVTVPSTLNPAGMDLENWREHGIHEDFARAQQVVIRAYEAFGVLPTCTCTPYLIGNRPRLGDHVAWSESSAVAFANSVLGARTNREGGPAALAAAILGKTARYGLHLDEERRPALVVDVDCRLETAADWGALGYLVGRMAGDRVPLLRLHRPPPGLNEASDLLVSPYLEHLKALGAAAGSAGAVGLYHIEGVTPEARRGGVRCIEGAEQATIEDLRPAYEALNAGDDTVDLVSVGCPHACLAELVDLVRLLRGRQVRTAFWVTSSRDVLDRARAEGLAQVLEAAGIRLMADTCLVVAPMQSFGYRTLATNSAKMAVYAPGHCGLVTRFGSLEQCVSAALFGRWQADPGRDG